MSPSQGEATTLKKISLRHSYRLQRLEATTAKVQGDICELQRRVDKNDTLVVGMLNLLTLYARLRSVICFFNTQIAAVLKVTHDVVDPGLFCFSEGVGRLSAICYTWSRRD